MLMLAAQTNMVLQARHGHALVSGSGQAYQCKANASGAVYRWSKVVVSRLEGNGGGRSGNQSL